MGLANNLVACALIANDFRKSSFGCWKPEFTKTVFPIIPLTSERPLHVTCPSAPPLRPALFVTSVSVAGEWPARTSVGLAAGTDQRFWSDEIMMLYTTNC